jgi:hypothetical protein
MCLVIKQLINLIQQLRPKAQTIKQIFPFYFWSTTQFDSLIGDQTHRKTFNLIQSIRQQIIPQFIEAFQHMSI